jgi:hypothetical protein
MDMLREFQTSDSCLAAVIAILLNIQPVFRMQNQKVIFCFPASDDIYRALSDFNNGIPINSFELVQMIKRFRAELMVRRKMSGGDAVAKKI